MEANNWITFFLVCFYEGFNNIDNERIIINYRLRRRLITRLGQKQMKTWDASS